jgi:superfamily I DNA and/or RNA helicase
MHIENVSVMLNTQYRMNQQIMNFSNMKFYKGNLIADASVKETVLSFDPNEFLLNTPLDFIDTAGCGYNEIVNPETLSIANPEEGQLLIKHLKLLLEQYAAASPAIQLSEKEKKKITIGIISPYKEQVQYLTNLIGTDEELETYRSQIAIKTVDGFQGQERDIIYISMVRSNDHREIGFLNDIRRMNVALTRAKKKLVVVGDSATIGNHPFYKDFLDYVEMAGAYKSAWEYIR